MTPLKKKTVKKKKINHLKVIVNDLTKKINLGVKYLDNKLGRKVWLQKVDETRLDLSNSHTCVIGQAFGDFWKDMGDDNPEKAIDCGFNVKDSDSDEYHGYAVMDILTHLWHCRIVGLKIEEGIELATIRN